MFGSIGVIEIVMIAGVALMVLGPDKFPEFAKMAARLVRDLKSYSTDIQREITKEMKPVKKELDDLKKIDTEKYIDSLVGEDDEEDDGSINLEPDPSTMDLYGTDQVAPEAPESLTPDNFDPAYGEYDTYPHETDGFETEEEESTEKLDG